MKMNRQYAESLKGARRWGRHVCAVVIAVAANAALAIGLASWQPSNGRAEDATHVGTPLAVVKLPAEEMELAEPTPDEPSDPVDVIDVAPSLPALPTPAMLSQYAALDLPGQVGPDTIMVPDVPAELPAFAAEAVVVTSTPTTISSTSQSGTVTADGGPSLLRPPDLARYYPRRALMRRVTGKTAVRVTVDADGRVTAASVLGSTPAGVFETAAKRVARTFRFRPAVRDGQPVAATVSMNLVWRLED